MTGRVVRVLHCSDIHCGRTFASEHVAAAERLARAKAFDAIVVSGDLTQRAREREFRDARSILDRLSSIAPVLTVPGNHDTEWWHAPFGFGDASRLYERWTALVQRETAPTVRVPGLSIVGMNSAHGTLPPALTWYPRDWRVKGGLTNAQLDDAGARLRASPAGDVRMLVLHHNVVRGRLSNRWGLTRPQHVLDVIGGMDVHVVCAGHDHEERADVVVRTTGTFVSSTANTLSRRARGHRASAVNVIEADAQWITVTAFTYDAVSEEFTVGSALRQARGA